MPVPDREAHLLAVAYHEAGHAVAARLFGQPLGSIRIDVETLGGESDSVRCDDERALIVVALAGCSAQRHHDPSRRFEALPSGVRNDVADYCLAREAIDSRMAHLYGDRDDARALRFFDRWCRFVDLLIASPPVWLAVDAVVHAIRAAGWLLLLRSWSLRQTRGGSIVTCGAVLDGCVAILANACR
jgi:hypothetical protein